MRADGKWRRTCVRMAASTALVLTISTMVAMGQTPEQKPAESYQTFYLNNSGQNAANDVQTSLRNMLPRAKIYYAMTENALSIRGSAEDLALAQKMLTDIDKPQKTYRITYTIIDKSIGPGGAQHFVLTVMPGSKTVFKQGSRVPIVTGYYKSEEPRQNTQVQYMDVGMTIEASLEGSGDGPRLHSKIEESNVADEKSNVGIQDPIVHQSVLENVSAVSAGKPTLLGSLDMPGSGKHMEVQVTAEMVR